MTIYTPREAPGAPSGNANALLRILVFHIEKVIRAKLLEISPAATDRKLREAKAGPAFRGKINNLALKLPREPVSGFLGTIPRRCIAAHISFL
jgi:hypothetical protein